MTRGIGKLRRIARRVTNLFVPRAIILLYHRVAELPSDPQLLCVSRRNFADHLQIVRQAGRTIQLKGLGQALERGNRGDCAIIVSFDDGYADNLYNARPLLERYDVPATVFVTAGYVGSKREFWYDDLERIFLSPRHLPEALRLNFNGHCHEWELGRASEYDEETYRNHREWNVSRKDNPTVRHRIYRSLSEMLHPLRDRERRVILDYVAAWAGMDAVHRPTHRTLSREEMIRLAEGGLVEIGAHTVSHPILSALPLVEQMEEIAQSKARLEEILGQTVTSFAYPFGGRSHYTEQTVTGVREAGFEWACSNFAGIVSTKTDRWQLPRFIVRDWDGEQFAHTLEGWIDG